MKKVQGPKIASTKVSTPKAAPKAAASAKPAAAKATKPASTFPTSAWADPAKLPKSIDTAHATTSHPRMALAKRPSDPIGGHPNRAPIAARFGLIPNPAHPAPRAPIAPRYGQIPTPGHPAPKPPPISGGYDLVPNTGQHPLQPPISARSGLAMPTRPGIPTTPRRGHSVD